MPKLFLNKQSVQKFKKNFENILKTFLKKSWLKTVPKIEKLQIGLTRRSSSDSGQQLVLLQQMLKKTWSKPLYIVWISFQQLCWWDMVASRCSNVNHHVFLFSKYFCFPRLHTIPAIVPTSFPWSSFVVIDIVTKSGVFAVAESVGLIYSSITYTSV